MRRYLLGRIPPRRTFSREAEGKSDGDITLTAEASGSGKKNRGETPQEEDVG